MSKKQESLRAELQKVLSRGGRPVISKSSDGKAVPVPDEAEVFEFDFTKDGESYGKVFVSIDGLHQLIVYFDNKVANSPKNGSADSESWEQLVRTLKRFATMKQLSFKLSDMDNLENDMAKRQHVKKQESVYEGYHAQGKKASYSDNVPTTKMIIKHKRNMEEGEQRFRQIDKIFIENSIGERALAPTDKPGLARVFARHIAEGGKANDERWNHISGLCEEYQKMAGFVRATRNNQFNESAQKLVAEGINHYQKLRESLSKMSGKRGYNTYFESYTPSLMENEESVDLSEMFMSSSLDPRIEGVMPILSKLSKNISETSEMAETIALEEWADTVIGESPKAAPTKTKPSDKEVAKRMHSILSKGKDGVEEAYQFKGGFPFDVDHMPGSRGINLPSAPTKKFFTDKKQWQQAVDDINSSKYDDNSDYIGVTGRSTVEIDGHEWARWSDAQQKGYIELSSMSEQGVAEGSKEKTPGIALSKAYKKDFDNKKPGQDRQETALTSTYSKTGKPGGELKKKDVAEDLDPEQKSAGQFSPKDACAKPGSLVGANESTDPLLRLKKLLGK